MTTLKSLCVFCGSSSGNRQDYTTASQILADVMYERDITLVYGGAHVGIMGSIADQMLHRGGKVIGVIPQALVDVEVAHDHLTELHVVPDMHARKSLMAAKADAFVALPGGLGTLEELFEVLTWAQLGFHQKPCGLLNVSGFYDSLIQFLSTATEAGFLQSEHRDLLVADTSAAELLDRLTAFQWSSISKLGIK